MARFVFMRGRWDVMTLNLIGAPSSAGAYAPGQEKAPAAFRRHGLVEALIRTGRRVRDRGDVTGFRWLPDPARPKAMNVDAVHRTASEVAVLVGEAMSADESVFVLGGDCTVELGTIAGGLSGAGRVGLVYIDLDVDLNTPATSDGALDWTGVAHLLDLPGSEPALSMLGSRRPMLTPTDVLYFGVDNISAPEAETMRMHAMEPIMLADVRADPSNAARRALAWGACYDRLFVHLDVDVLSFVDFPIAENVRRRNGLTLDQLATGLAPIVAAPNWRGLTLTEVNPDHAPDEAAAFGTLIDMLSRALAP
jgi:arginase